MRNLLASVLLIAAAASILLVFSGMLHGGSLDSGEHGGRLADWLSSRSP